MKMVTICVPTFNSESTLSATLESILSQTYTDISVKIFDNASTDRTLDVARAFAAKDTRVQVFANSENLGAEGNFNRCLAAAEGFATAIFHADDVYEPGIVAAQTAFLIANPNVVAVATHAAIIDAKGAKKGERFLPPSLRQREISFDFQELNTLVSQFGNFITCPSVMARSDVYRDKIRTWNGKQFGSSADLDVWLRLAQVGRFGLLTTPLMRYRESEASFTVRETKRRFTEHDFLSVLRHYSSKPSRFLQFHEFKDVAARRLNILLARRNDLPFPEFQGDLTALLPLLFHSRYHFKFMQIGLAIFAATGTMKFLRLHR